MCTPDSHIHQIPIYVHQIHTYYKHPTMGTFSCFQSVPALPAINYSVKQLITCHHHNEGLRCNGPPILCLLLFVSSPLLSLGYFMLRHQCLPWWPAVFSVVFWALLRYATYSAVLLYKLLICAHFSALCTAPVFVPCALPLSLCTRRGHYRIKLHYLVESNDHLLPSNLVFEIRVRFCRVVNLWHKSTIVLYILQLIITITSSLRFALGLMEL